MTPKRKVAVFGGDGFIGSHLVDQLVAMGHTVTVFDRFAAGSSKNLAHQKDTVRMVSGDAHDSKDLKLALEGQDVAYHLICPSNPILGWADPQTEINVNLALSLHFFEACVEAGVRKIAFASSGGTVYGEYGGILHENSVLRPFNPHGICKLAAENYLEYCRRKHGISTEVYRISNPFGPRQQLHASQGVIAVWMGRILDDLGIEVFGDETSIRNYIYVEDAAHLMTHALRDLDASDTFNISSGCGVSILELLDIFKSTIDRPFEYRQHPRRASDIPANILSCHKILERFPGFRFRDLKEMIRTTWRDLVQTYRTPSVSPGQTPPQP